MARESIDYILNISHRPNRTAVLLAIPMYMYRIETKRIEYGINFFQKAVLMFKTKPGIEDSTIANCLGLDEKLVNIISEQLVTKKLINSDGRLTDRGREMKNDIDGLIVDETQKSIGYVFQHFNDDGLYSFYVNNIRKATVINGDICTGLKGEAGEEDYYSTPILAEKLLENQVTNPAPTEREIISLIKRSNKHASTNVEVELLDLDTKRFGISFIPNNHPSIVWICTYAFVPRIKDDIFKSEWQIQDPFGFQNNAELKLYVESLLSDGLIDDFTVKFKDLKTENDQTIDSFQEMMDRLVDQEMEKTFEVGYHKLDKNLLKYLKAILKNFLLLKRTIEIDACSSFIGNIQNALETIFKLDFERSESTYRKVHNSLKHEFRLNGKRSDFYLAQDRYDYIEELFYTGGLKADVETERKMKDLSQKFDNLNQAKSLKHYLIKFLFGHKFDENNPLFDIIKEKVGIIYKIANLRNIGSHGRTSNESQIQLLSNEDINLYFKEITSIINNYIIHYNG